MNKMSRNTPKMFLTGALNTPVGLRKHITDPRKTNLTVPTKNMTDPAKNLTDPPTV
jgi:hypothetical protein